MEGCIVPSVTFSRKFPAQRYVSQMTSESHFADPENVLPQFSLLPKLFRNSEMPY